PLELARELATHVEDAGRRAPQPAVLVEALLDRGLVDRAGTPSLAPAHPLHDGAAEQVERSGEEPHGNPPQASPGFTASSTEMPSSRIFCWKFCRYMPTSSAALVMLPPWRRSACRRKSRSNPCTACSFASRKVAGGGAGVGVAAPIMSGAVR